MATQVGSLFTSLTLESASFVAGLKRATDATEKSARSIDKALGVAKTAVGGFLAAFSVGAIVDVTRKALDHAASLGEVSQQLGVTTRDLQVYRYAATQAGLSQEEMDKTLAKLTQTIGKAVTGSKSAAEVFKALGINLKEAGGSTRDTGEVIRDIADRLAKIPDPAKRAAIEVELFGRTGQKLDTLLAGGTAAIDELSAAADQLGLVLSNEQIARADETADKMAALWTVLQTRIAGFVADNSDAILKLANAIGYVAQKAADGVDAVSRFFDAAKERNLKRIVNDNGLFGTGLFGASSNDKATAWAELQRMRAGRPAPTGSSPTSAPLPASPDITLHPGKAPKARAAKKERDEIKAYLEGLPPLAEEVGRTFESLADRMQGALASFPTEKVQDFSVAWEELANTDTIKTVEATGKILTESAQRATDFAENLTDGLGQAVIYGQSLGDALINSIKAATAELVASGLMDLLMGKVGPNGQRAGGVMTAAVTAIGSFFGGGRAVGGPVEAGKFYRVGEQGPELLYAGTSGQVIPNGALRGMSGGGNTTVINIDARYATEGTAEMIQRQLAAAAPAIVNASVGKVMDSQRRRGSWR